MAAVAKDYLCVPDHRHGFSRANSLGRKEHSSDKRRSPSPAAPGYCTYSRLSAMRENGIFRKYLANSQSNDKEDESDGNPTTSSERKLEASNIRAASLRLPERSQSAGRRNSPMPDRPQSAGRRNSPMPDRSQSAELRPPRRTIVSSKQDERESLEEKPRSSRVPVRASSASRASSSSRESRKSDGRRESYQTIRKSLEQFANKDTTGDKDIIVSSGQSTVSESAKCQVKACDNKTDPIKPPSKMLKEPISRISRVPKQKTVDRSTNGADRVSRSTDQRQRSSSTVREPGRQLNRPVTPSFDEFKKRVKIPTLHEFRKRQDDKPPEPTVSKSSSFSNASKVDKKPSLPAEPTVSKSSSFSNASKDDKKPSLPDQRQISSISTKSVGKMSVTDTKQKPSQTSTSRCRVSKQTCESIPKKVLTEVSIGLRNHDNSDGDVFLSKGLRLKPSYIPDQAEKDDGEWTLDSPRIDTPLDNSLDDNILVSTYLDEGSSKKGDNFLGCHGEFKVDPNAEAPVAKGAKRMDKDGNFWIVLNEEVSQVNEEVSEVNQEVSEVNAKEHLTEQESKKVRESTEFTTAATPVLTDPDSSSSLEHEGTEASNNILRSTSDVSDLAASTGRKRKDRKERPHKSDPFSRSERMRHRQQLLKEGSLFHGLSYNSINTVSSGLSMRSLNELTDEAADECDAGVKRRGQRRSNLSTCSEDSGVIGRDKSPDSRTSDKKDFRHKENGMTECGKAPYTGTLTLDPDQTGDRASSRESQTGAVCLECGKPLDVTDTATTTTTTTNQASSCRRCDKKRTERLRTLQEIVETEATYRRDLKILKEEFYLPIKSAGLLSLDQLGQIFLNIDELLQVNYDFLQQLKGFIGSSVAGTGNNSTIGELFLKASSQFLAFKTYCINQSSAAALLEQFERENEVLKVFLQVSQSENTRLRKMNLKSFHVIPIQRITKYPLLLNRLYKATPTSHNGRFAIKEAMERIEDILDYINEKAQGSGQGSIRSKRRKPESKSCSMLERFELIKVAQDQVSWERADISEVLVGKLHLASPTDHTWAIKKGKTLKFSQVFGVVLTQGKPTRKSEDVAGLCFPKPTTVKQAVLCLLREKNDQYQPIREPLLLNRCIVSVDPDYPEVFEVQEWNKESYILKADQPDETQNWVNHLKQRWIDIAPWRRRRNGLANIMIKQTG